MKEPFESAWDVPPADTAASVRLPAGFLRRAVAYLIDMAIFSFLFFFLSVAGWLATLLASPDLSLNQEVDGPLSIFLTPALIVLFFSYFTFFHSYGGQTPGKILVRIKVVGDDGGPLSGPRAFIRTVGYFLSSIFFFAGFLLALVEKRGRTLHDFLSRSEVVQV